MEKFGRFLLAAALTIPLLTTGCAAHLRVNAWGPGEAPYYARWEHDTHRNHEDWNQRDRADQRAYWRWRHQQH
ncbi:MAG: hypothetical protein ACRD3N_00810 [Terracidiphilus sp.]